MLSHSDIKIGNYVQDKKGNIVKVLSTMLDGINYSFENNKCVYTYTEIEPILLTDNIISQFEWNNTEEIYACRQYNVNGIIFRSYNADNELVYCTNDIHNQKTNEYIIPSVKYVHELQNLHTALIKRELDLSF